MAWSTWVKDHWIRQMTEQDQIVRLATRELLQLAEAYPGITFDEFELIYGAIVDKYGNLAASSALIAVENSRRAADLWEELPTPEIAGPVPEQQVKKSLAWAAGSASVEDVRSLALVLTGPLGRLVQQRARQTVWNAAASSGGKARYARLPEPGACAFCLMLASRGAVYTSQTVLSTGEPRPGPARQTHFRNRQATAGHTYTTGRRPEGLKFHDNCRCISIESYSRADLPQVVQDLEDEWQEVTWSKHGQPLPNQIGLWKQHILDTRGHP